jgi:hypothetical protein
MSEAQSKSLRRVEENLLMLNMNLLSHTCICVFCDQILSTNTTTTTTSNTTTTTTIAWRTRY